mgnify:CR=1 FL=1
MSFGRPSTRLRPFDFHAGLGVLRAGRANLDLDLLCRALTDQQVVFALDESDDALVQRVARASHAAAGDDARQADDSDLRRAAANVHDHAADASVVGRPLPMAAAIGSSMTVTWRAPALAAAWRTARRSTSVTPEGTQMTTRGASQNAVAAGLADEALQHGRGNVKIRNNAVLEGAHRHDGAGCAANDRLGLMADAAHPQLVAARVHGDDAWLAHDDAAALHVHKGVGGARSMPMSLVNIACILPKKHVKKLQIFPIQTPVSGAVRVR